jgi:DUF1365 family protein
MNLLQSIDSARALRGHAEPHRRIDPAKIIARMDYAHPIYTPRQRRRAGAPGRDQRPAPHLVRRRLLGLGLPRGRHAQRRHVRHRRFRPHPHDFRYRIAQLLIDLDELPTLFAGRWFWSLERANLVSFRRRDYLGDPAIPLKQAVLDRVETATGARPDGPVRMLAHLKMFGLCFNPVVFYYCHHRDGTLAAIVAEITNTPWDERHAYVLPVAMADRHGQAGRVLGWRFDKIFHVSPFLPMGLRYDWRRPWPTAS